MTSTALATPDAAMPAATPRQPWRIPRVRRVQHFFYYHGSAVGTFMRLRIRPAGIGLLLSLGITTFVAVGNPETTAVYQIFCLGITLCLAALLWLPFRRASLEITREMPLHATAGAAMQYRLVVRNLKSSTLQSIALLETPPDSRPGLQAFIHRFEPGEGARNAFDRFFVAYRWMWLSETRASFRQASQSESFNLGPHGRISIPMAMVPSRRGLIQLRDLRALTPEPLGLFQRALRTRTPTDTLIILPRRFRLPPFELPGSARFQPGGDAASRNPGPSGDFMGLREYQPGDPLRLIHWPTWARTGRPVVRELEDTFYPRYGLILDTFASGENAALFEDAVSVAASFISAADTSESLIDLMFIAGAERVVSAGGGIGRTETLLEVLAGVEASEDEDFDSLVRLVMRHSEDLAGCLCIFAGWSPSRERFMTKMAVAGIECAALVISSEPNPSLPPRCHALNPATLQQDLLLLPSQF